MPFSELQKSHDLDLGSVQGHIGVHMWSGSTHTPNDIEIGKTFVDVRTDMTSNSRSIRTSPGDDLKLPEMSL